MNGKVKDYPKNATVKILLVSYHFYLLLICIDFTAYARFHYVPGSHGSHGSQKRSSPWCV